jgi:uncharacterized protein (UPF0332 family)
LKERPGKLAEHLLSRSCESLEEARILAGSGHWNTCVNRLYYSCFYAASAILEKNGLSSAKHSGVRSLFNNHFARTGLVAKEVAAIYNDLFDRRQESDYGPFFVFEESDVRPWFNKVETFVNTMSAFVNENA